MSDFVEFLVARIIEDERVARYALTSRDAPYSVYGLDWLVRVDHADRWGPARVLIECDAKRRIIALHAPWGGGDGFSARCEVGCENHGRSPDEAFPCDTLRLLALPYVDHPDFREEWAPC